MTETAGFKLASLWVETVYDVDSASWMVTSHCVVPPQPAGHQDR